MSASGPSGPLVKSGLFTQVLLYIEGPDPMSTADEHVGLCLCQSHATKSGYLASLLHSEQPLFRD